MGVSGWMFLLVPAYPGCPGSKAVKRSLLLLLLLYSTWHQGIAQFHMLHMFNPHPLSNFWGKDAAHCSSRPQKTVDIKQYVTMHLYLDAKKYNVVKCRDWKRNCWPAAAIRSVSSDQLIHSRHGQRSVANKASQTWLKSTDLQHPTSNNDYHSSPINNPITRHASVWRNAHFNMHTSMFNITISNILL